MRGQAERGAVLLVSLVMLVLLTLIGLAGMRMVQLEERMAGNLRDRQMAFQAAEAALRAGEATALARYRRDGPMASVDAAEGVASGFSDSAAQPVYRLRFLRWLLSEGVEVGKGGAANGVAIEVRATGYGVRRQPSGEPVSSVRLSSIYFIR
ncbi:MAG: pilus assembly protein PilX [Pseudomonas sp.]|uniref:pilus assembly PilX family protein n=1 Tax=Pseudomonas sp. TaxID=306 RepID=UPI000CB35FF4|nr:PilX N-terminal domain-containing pilus assembly protein [Pseudomonas sp.]PJI46436.1 MAG: pilus assembly protein PilX [Pseudomonas sp.]